MFLNELKLNESGIIKKILYKGINHQRIVEMGITPGNTIKLINYAPMGDPIEFYINGYSLSLRKEDARNIIVEKKLENIIEEDALIPDNIHPGIGENGIFHNKKEENPLKKEGPIHFVLIGNPNSGKTTFFNNITGSNQHVGNFPGVTVEIKEGLLLNNNNILITDLPGIYSLTPYSEDEAISTNYIINNQIDGIINIIDITSIERGLFITEQLLELDIPIVLGLNMYDEFKKQNSYININILEKRLGIPVVPISAINNQGCEELLEHAIHVAYYQEKPIKNVLEIKDNIYLTIQNTIKAMEHLLDKNNIKLPSTFIATKYLEKNDVVLKKDYISKDVSHTFNHIVKQMENDTGLDQVTAITSYRYTKIKQILKNILKRKNTVDDSLSSKIDKLLIGKYTAIPFFILIMSFIFYITFNIIGPSLQLAINNVIIQIDAFIKNFFILKNVSPFIQSFVLNGIISGIGTIVSFIPTVLCLFLFISILEDTGYISRIAFIMDKPLRKVGLSGRSIIPLLLGFGCTVPAILSSRTLPSKKDRETTIFLTPFISCSAKLPIYGFFCNYFFPNYSGLIITGLYLFGIILSLLIAYIYKKTRYVSDTIPFIMELPPYRIPKIKNVIFNLWLKAKEYLKKTFSIILIATILIWLLSNLKINMTYTTNQSDSILALISKYLSILFIPLGFGNWQSTISLLSGFMAKESVVSTLNILVGNNIHTFFTASSSISFLVFCLLYTPCIATISAVKNELGTKKAISLIIRQCLFAWFISFVVYKVALLIL